MSAVATVAVLILASVFTAPLAAQQPVPLTVDEPHAEPLAPDGGVVRWFGGAARGPELFQVERTAAALDAAPKSWVMAAGMPEGGGTRIWPIGLAVGAGVGAAWLLLSLHEASQVVASPVGIVASRLLPPAAIGLGIGLLMDLARDSDRDSREER